MGLKELDKETRAVMEEAAAHALSGNEVIQRATEFFADKGERGLAALFDQTKDIAESVEEIDKRIADQEKSFSGRMERVTRMIRGPYGQYRGGFATEDAARSTGLLVMRHFGNKRADEVLKAEFGDLHARALSGQTLAEGGALLAPAEMLNMVIWLKEQYGLFASKVPESPIGSGETGWVKDTGEPYMNVRGELEQAITENTFQLGKGTLKPREWYTLYFYPETLEEDSAVSLADMMLQRIAWTFAYWGDKCGFMGDATAAYKGIYGLIPKLLNVGTAGVVTASGVTAFANVTDAHLLAVQGLLPNYADTNNGQTGGSSAEWYMHRKFFFGAVTRLARATGGFTAEEFAGRRRLAYNGNAINITQVVNSTGGNGEMPVVFGDLGRTAKRGVRRRMRIRKNENVRWLQGQIAVMADLIHDIVIQNVGDASTVETMTGLKLAT